MKKFLCILFAVLLTAVSVTGCGQKEETKTPDPSVTVEDGDPMPNTKVSKLLSGLKESDPDYYFKLAEFAVSDVLDHFWDHENNHVLPTWNGLPVDEDDDDPRGSFWETAQCLYGIYDMWLLTKDSRYEKMLQGQAKFIKDNFTIDELTKAGGNENWAVDDCAWNCMLYMIMYDLTGDKWFIEVTDGLLESVTALWGDDVTGGGMWYNSDRQVKSVYELGCVMSWFRLWQITGEQRYYDTAWAHYEWMCKVLGDRDDGLYYCDVYSNGPRGGTNDIHEGGSASFLTGNMGVAALSMMFYNETKDESLKERALKTCEGLLQKYNNGGVLLDDRDGWTNGAFASYFASYVLTLEGTEEIRALCQATAKSVIMNARTPDGYYGASWQGPSEGSMSIWWSGGTIPQQSATTGTAVSMVTSMAILEAGITDYIR